MPKKSIVTYSKRKYKPRPELGSLLTTFHGKGKTDKQPNEPKASQGTRSLASKKETPDLQDSTMLTNEQDTIDSPQMEQTADKPQTNVIESDDAENGIDTFLNQTRVDKAEIDQNQQVQYETLSNIRTRSSSATGKQKNPVEKKVNPTKKSLSISRTRREKELEMQQKNAKSNLTATLDPPVLTKADQSTVDKEESAHQDNLEHVQRPKDDNHPEPKQCDSDEEHVQPIQQDNSSHFDNLQASLDLLNLSPIGNPSFESRIHRRMVSSTPMASKTQQHTHVSIPLKSFSQSMKNAEIDMSGQLGRLEDKMVDDVAAFTVANEPQTKAQEDYPKVGRPEAVDDDLEMQSMHDVDIPLAPASTTGSDLFPHSTNRVMDLEVHRKAIEASIAEPSIHDLSHAQIWSPPRSPSIEAARRQSQHSGSQNIPEGLFEWFGNSIASQAAVNEQDCNLDEELEQFLTPEQLNMTVEQFMRSIYEEKIDQIRKEGQQRIDRLSEELARVRAKLLAELDFDS
ncbi:hypothetical protein Unana1_01338 [Umbelopsis nana]